VARGDACAPQTHRDANPSIRLADREGDTCVRWFKRLWRSLSEISFERRSGPAEIRSDERARLNFFSVSKLAAELLVSFHGNNGAEIAKRDGEQQCAEAGH
jgi:hypothetical protein